MIQANQCEIPEEDDDGHVYGEFTGHGGGATDEVFMRIIVNVLLRMRKIQLRMMVSTRITPMMPPHYTDRFLISAMLYMHIREKQEGLKLFPDIALHL